MKVDQTRRSSVSKVKTSRGGAAVQDGHFNNLLTSEQKVDVIASTNRISAMDSIVSVQEVSDDDGGDSGTKKRAHQILDRLEDVRMGLLMGQIPKSDLMALSDILTVAREKVVDSSLLELLDDIELRAKIELAKLDAIN
ncbi:MAG: flagellar assembly protein FliX [Alphaproteobacteria bacterium]|nr:flagellar assembly protein FliX [Alphaproteobacteria bacterium]